jgi:hypothetical protein
MLMTFTRARRARCSTSAARHNAPNRSLRITRCRCARSAAGIVAWVCTGSAGDVMGAPTLACWPGRSIVGGQWTVTHGRRYGRPVAGTVLEIMGSPTSGRRERERLVHGISRAARSGTTQIRAVPQPPAGTTGQQPVLHLACGRSTDVALIGTAPGRTVPKRRWA